MAIERYMTESRLN